MPDLYQLSAAQRLAESMKSMPDLSSIRATTETLRKAGTVGRTVISTAEVGERAAKEQVAESAEMIEERRRDNRSSADPADR
jgi:hypothetical protein